MAKGHLLSRLVRTNQPCGEACSHPKKFCSGDARRDARGRLRRVKLSGDALSPRMLPAWLGWSAVARSAAPVKLILDTDMGGGACRDVDDVVALCTLHAMMDNGEVGSPH